ncbi:MAG: VapC toxin family PIN domain ribonuclease [Candidatus Brocadia sp. WS118]|nr:MAG: VapC toxin family PIN domain ribonuclease [Candidatus Brocadia sp. WS118]
MDQYLIDTDICVHFLKGRFRINDKVREAGLDNCYISEITIVELTYGAYKSTDFKKHILEVKKMEVLFEIIPIYGSINKYAEERVRLQKAGTLIPDFDLLIGTTAVANNLIMVTNNERHLSRTSGIVIENWTKKEFNKHIK